MRNYSKVSSKFWIGETGRHLRRQGVEAQLVALYLLTSPHSNMLGLYYCPVQCIAHETGLGIEGASKGLQRAIEAHFCYYDEETEFVWVPEMALYQIEAELKPNDNRVKGIQSAYSELPKNPFLTAFYEKYRDAFCLAGPRVFPPENGSPFKAPSKPHRSQEQEQELEQEQKQEQEHKRTTLSGKPDVVQNLTEQKKINGKTKKPVSSEHTEIIDAALNHLNEKTGSKFSAVESNAKLIRARIAEGATLENLCAVIDYKVRDWIDNPKMRQFLRPATLFNAEKFNQYAGQLSVKTEADEWADYFGDAKPQSTIIDIDAEVIRRDH